MSDPSNDRKLTHANDAPVSDNVNIQISCISAISSTASSAAIFRAGRYSSR